MKRSLDVIASFVGLLILSPLLAGIALVVKATSPGPVIFKQTRVGRNFSDFTLYKFRTMSIGAIGPTVTSGQDPRITRVGGPLRRSKLDELPQLFNVLVGDMSLVGPRPEVREFVELHLDRFAKVLSVRPGITDPASIAFRNEQELLGREVEPLDFYRNELLPQKLDLSIDYIERQSVARDLLLIIKTVLPSG